MPLKRRQRNSDPPTVDTPFSNLLPYHSSHGPLPSPEETALIRKAVAEMKEKLAVLNGKVPRRSAPFATAKKIPRQLRIELDAARRFVRMHQAVIAPWRRLPVELLSDIFVRTLKPLIQDRDFVPRKPYMGHGWVDDRLGTLNVAQVCHRWRQIALGTPRLWNVYVAELWSPSYWSLPRPVVARPPEQVSTWLDRAAAVPLYLALHWSSTRVEEASSLLETLAKYIPRAAAFAVGGADKYLGTATLRYAPVAAQRMPRLTSIHASHAPMSVREALALMVAAPALHSLSVHLRVGELDGDLTADALRNVACPLLQSLEIATATHLPDFVSPLRLPALTTLTLRGISPSNDLVRRDALIGLFARSRCTLQELHLDFAPIPGAELAAYLNHPACHTLHELNLTYCDPHIDPVLIHLTHQTGLNALRNPALRTLGLIGITPTAGLVADMVQSRLGLANGQGKNLAELVLRFEGADAHARYARDLTRLKQLEAANPDFVLT